MNKKIFISMFALVAFAFSACDNDVVVLDNNTDVPNNDFAPVASNIRVFSSVDELFTEIDKTLAMSLEELYIHEKTLNQSVSAGGSMLRTAAVGFNSFGKIADMLYESIAVNEDEYTLEQVRALVSMHPEHLVLIKEEDGYYTFETRLFDSDLRFIINEDRMFQMRDTLVKVLDSATIFTSKANYRELLAITDANVALIDTENFLVVSRNFFNPVWPPVTPPPTTGTPRPNPNLGREIRRQEHISHSGNRRNRLWVEVFIPDERIVRGNYITERCAIRIRSHRTGIADGIWWRKQRNHEFDITVRVWHPNRIVSFRFNHGIRPIHNWEITRFGSFTYNFSQGRACIVSVNGRARNEVNSLEINLN